MKKRERGRPRKGSVELTEDTIEALLAQSNDIAEDNLQKARTAFNKLKNDIKDLTEESMVGRQKVDLLKIMSESSKQKVEIAKTIQVILKDKKLMDKLNNAASSGETATDGGLSSDILDMLQKRK
jgi:hypothetical protein